MIVTIMTWLVSITYQFQMTNANVVDYRVPDPNAYVADNKQLQH